MWQRHGISRGITIAFIIGIVALTVLVTRMSGATQEPTSTPIGSPATGVPATTGAVTHVPVQSSNEQFLHTEGADLRYRGLKVVLKGTNFDNIPALGAGIGSGDIEDISFSEADYAELSRQGPNHVRLGLSFNWYQENPARFFKKIDEQVRWARKYNVWIVLNMFTTPGDCYEGYGKSCGLWERAAEQQELQAFWAATASHYRDEPAIAGYDLLNEPTPPEGCEQWFSIARSIRDAVFAITPQQLVFISTCSDPANDLQLDQLPRGQNIVYEAHDYSPLAMSHASAEKPASYPGIVSDWYGSCYFDQATFAGESHRGSSPLCANADIRETYGITWAKQQNVPIYIGEWGASGFLAGANQYHQDKAELYRDWEINHAHYTWKHNTIKTGGEHIWGMYSRSSSLDDPEKLESVGIAWQGAVKPNFSP